MFQSLTKSFSRSVYREVQSTLPMVRQLNLERTLQELLREKCPCLEFFWSVFGPNEGKYGPEKLQI